MVASAPRYDPLIREAARRLDDPSQPLAETCRRVGALAELLDLPRPSYSHLRRIVKAERLRRRETEGVLAGLVGDALAGRSIRLAAALELFGEADTRAKLRVRQG